MFYTVSILSFSQHWSKGFLKNASNCLRAFSVRAKLRRLAWFHINNLCTSFFHRLNPCQIACWLTVPSNLVCMSSAFALQHHHVICNIHVQEPHNWVTKEISVICVVSFSVIPLGIGDHGRHDPPKSFVSLRCREIGMCPGPIPPELGGLACIPSTSLLKLRYSEQTRFL